MKPYTPYIYLLQHKTTKYYYVGVRYAKTAHPSNFWKDYFTSSKIVHKLIDVYGKEDFRYRIIKTFNNAEDAIIKEQKLTALAIKKPNYLNASSMAAPRVDICSLAGKIGGNIQVKLKQGIHKQTKEERLLLASKGGKKGAFTQPKWQSIFGKRGGAKNKGKLFITNGIETKKINSGEALPDGWKYGRNLHIFGKRWCNDGQRNYFVYPEKIEKNGYILGRLPEDKSKYIRKSLNGNKIKKN